jgi:hypothetical protein
MHNFQPVSPPDSRSNKQARVTLPAMKKDYRTKARRQVRYKAWLQTADGAAAKPCSFADVSEGGARLQIEDAEAVPGEVELRVAENAEGRPCHVVWRSKTEVGLRFDQPATAGNAGRRR